MAPIVACSHWNKDLSSHLAYFRQSLHLVIAPLVGCSKSLPLLILVMVGYRIKPLLSLVLALLFHSKPSPCIDSIPPIPPL